MDPGWGNLGVRQEIDSGREGGWGDTRPEQRQRSECILLTENFEALVYNDGDGVGQLEECSSLTYELLTASDCRYALR